MEKEERHISAYRHNKGKVKKYTSKEINGFISEEDVIGLDANVLVDGVEYPDFKEELERALGGKDNRLFTTNVALGEAKHVLIKKRGYTEKEAKDTLLDFLSKIKIKRVKHIQEANRLGNEWVGKVKKKMHIKKFSTFSNDLKILSNLVIQAGVNLYFTEDKDVKVAVRILNLPVRVKILLEAKNLQQKKVSEFFRKNRTYNKGRRRR